MDRLQAGGAHHSFSRRHPHQGRQSATGALRHWPYRHQIRRARRAGAGVWHIRSPVEAHDISAAAPRGGQIRPADGILRNSAPRRKLVPKRASKKFISRSPMKSWRRLRSSSRSKTRKHSVSRCSNSQVRQHVADGVDDLHELGMRFLKFLHGRTSCPSSDSFNSCGFLLLARGFVRGDLRESGDALGLFGVGLGQTGHFGLQRRQHLLQLARVFPPGWLPRS